MRGCGNKNATRHRFSNPDKNKVFAVRSGGTMGVVVKGPLDTSNPINFRMEDKGEVISIKFSLDQKVLAIQRTKTSVEFMNFNGTELDGEYSHSCKKNATLLGYVWSQANEVALITDHGIELYMVIPEKKSLKQLKTTSISIQWFVWCPQNKIALLASGHGSHLQPVVFKPGSINKLSKLETEQGRMTLERDVTLATLYDIPAVIILRHQTTPQTAEAHVYTLNGPGQAPVKNHILQLKASGRFAINVVDDLILVHHQASRSSQVFDIALPGESDGTITYHKCIAPARSFKPASLSLPGLVESQKHACELYSPKWVVFQPNIVIDAMLGCLWYIELHLPILCLQMSDLPLCTQLTLNRTSGKAVLLNLLLEHIKLPKPNLTSLQDAFNHINSVYRTSVEAEIQLQIASPAGAPLPAKPQKLPRVIINQLDVYQQLLLPLIDKEQLLQNIEWTLICYITSLAECEILTEHILNELLITTMVRRKKFTALMQLLQYGVIADSKPLACLLLSLGNLYPGASQLALDMLSRLGAHDEIQEILIDQGQLLAALKLSHNEVSPRKFLEAAQNSGDPTLFHSVLYCFKSNLQYSKVFSNDERLDNFIQHYITLFPETTDNSSVK